MMRQYLGSSHARSLRWRQDFIRSYLEPDIPQFGPPAGAPAGRGESMIARLRMGAVSMDAVSMDAVR